MQIFVAVTATTKSKLSKRNIQNTSVTSKKRIGGKPEPRLKSCINLEF